jgi:hypothetical protein
MPAMTGAPFLGVATAGQYYPTQTLSPSGTPLYLNQTGTGPAIVPGPPNSALVKGGGGGLQTILGSLLGGGIGGKKSGT